MKVPTEQQLLKRVKYWQGQLVALGIGHWQVRELAVVQEEDDMPGGAAVASVKVPEHYDEFRIAFCANQIELMLDQDELDSVIVHELIHVAMRDLDSAINSVAEDLAPVHASEWGVRVHHEREGLVDRLARAFVNVSRA